MYIPVTNPRRLYKHSECIARECNSIYRSEHVVKINPFSVFITDIALSLYLLNEMQTMAQYSLAWAHMEAGTHSTLYKYPRGCVVVTAIGLIKSCLYSFLDCVDGEEVKKIHICGKAIMKHHRHDYYRHPV